MENIFLSSIRQVVNQLRNGNTTERNQVTRLDRELTTQGDDYLSRLKNLVLGYGGSSSGTYEHTATNYVSHGYNHNPIVYSVVSQMANKTASIPFYIKKVEDKIAYQKWLNLRSVTKHDYTFEQKLRSVKLEIKAFQQDLPFPLEKPNPFQTWTEFHALYKTYLKLTGNVFLYKYSPSMGTSAGVPKYLFILPTHLVDIVTRTYDKDFSMLDVGLVQEYLLRFENSYSRFTKSEIIHIKYPNPNFSLEGAHLYGVAPLRSALRNIESSNLAIDLNIKTLKSGGAFGFIHAKKNPLNHDQAKEIKERLLEMEASPEKLSKLAGISTEVGFTRISLTTDELKPFDYLKFDTKQICNVLAWSDKLLNNDDGAKYDNVLQFRKWVVTDNIMPDLDLLADALNREFLPFFPAYKGTAIVYDSTELPEMQTDTKQLADWLNNALDRGVITRNEYREAVKFSKVDDENMNKFSVQNDILTLNEAFDNSL